MGRKMLIKLPPFPGVSGPQPNTGFFGPTRVRNPIDNLVGLPITAKLVVVTNRHTRRDTDGDHATSAAKGRSFTVACSMVCFSCAGIGNRRRRLSNTVNYLRLSDVNS